MSSFTPRLLILHSGIGTIIDPILAILISLIGFELGFVMGGKTIVIVTATSFAIWLILSLRLVLEIGWCEVINHFHSNWPFKLCWGILTIWIGFLIMWGGVLVRFGIGGLVLMIVLMMIGGFVWI